MNQLTKAVARARAVVENEVMLDHCTLVRPDKEQTRTLNETTGEYMPSGPAAAVYSGKCAVRITGQSVKVEGGVNVAVETYRMLIPVTATEPLIGDLDTDRGLIVDEVQGMDSFAAFQGINLYRLRPATAQQ